MTIQEAFERLTDIANQTREISDTFQANVSVETIRLAGEKHKRFSVLHIGDYELYIHCDGTMVLNYFPVGSDYYWKTDIDMSDITDVLMPPDMEKPPSA